MTRRLGLLAPGASDSNAQIPMTENVSATLGSILRYNGTVNQWQLWGLSTGGTEVGPHLVVGRDNGRVGVGTTSPTQLLHLNHICTEGPEPMNAYSGNVINEEGDEFIQAMVIRKIRQNRFVIRTSEPQVEVSWRVDGVRNDRWVQKHRFQTEELKPQEQRGNYLQPDLYERASTNELCAR